MPKKKAVKTPEPVEELEAVQPADSGEVPSEASPPPETDGAAEGIGVTEPADASEGAEELPTEEYAAVGADGDPLPDEGVPEPDMSNAPDFCGGSLEVAPVESEERATPPDGSADGDGEEGGGEGGSERESVQTGAEEFPPDTPADESVRQEEQAQGAVAAPIGETPDESAEQPEQAQIESPAQHALTAEAAERRAFFNLDFHELDRGLSPEERQEWNSIYASYRGRSVMTGVIAGVDPHSFKIRDKATGEVTWRTFYCAVVIPFRVPILIPETELWARGEERPRYVTRNMGGATIDFVVTQVDREAKFVLASRRLALASRRYYFSTQPSLNRPGARLQCSLLAVGPRRCLATCYGYDVEMTQRDLDYSAIADLRDVYHRGDTLDCIVKEYESRANRLVLSVKETIPNPFDGADFRHPEGCSRQAVISGKYAGGVFCNLTDGVTVMCNYSFQYEDAEFQSGDRVTVVIQRYAMEKKQIYGKIVAKE